MNMSTCHVNATSVKMSIFYIFWCSVYSTIVCRLVKIECLIRARYIYKYICVL